MQPGKTNTAVKLLESIGDKENVLPKGPTEKNPDVREDEEPEKAPVNKVDTKSSKRMLEKAASSAAVKRPKTDSKAKRKVVPLPKRQRKLTAFLRV